MYLLSTHTFQYAPKAVARWTLIKGPIRSERQFVVYQLCSDALDTKTTVLYDDGNFHAC